MQDAYINFNQIADMYDISVSTVKRANKKGVFKTAIKNKLELGFQWLVKQKEVEELGLECISPKVFRERRQQEIGKKLQKKEYENLEERVRTLEHTLKKIASSISELDI